MTLLTGLLAGLLVGAGWWLLGGGVNDRLQSLIRPSGRALMGREDGPGLSGPEHLSGPGTADGAVARSSLPSPPMSPVEALAFDLDLVSICLQTGLPTERALSLAAAAGGNRTGLDRLARSLALGEVDDSQDELAAVGRLVLFSRSTGVALAPLLRGLAGDLRRSEHRRRQVAAARLGVELVVPLGVCILPAFLLLGVVPVVLSLIDDMAVLFT